MTTGVYINLSNTVIFGLFLTENTPQLYYTDQVIMSVQVSKQPALAA